MLEKTSNALCIFGDNVTVKLNYDSNFTSENYQYLFNKIVSVVKVVYRKNFIKNIYVSTCNVSGLIAACAAIKAREELNLNKEQIRIIVCTPSKKASTLFNKKHEIKMWNYIAKNLNNAKYIPNKDGNIKNNELEIYSYMVEHSNISLVLLPMKNKNFYINPNTGLTSNGTYTCSMYAMNKAIKKKKDIRTIALEDVTYKNLTSSHV